MIYTHAYCVGTVLLSCPVSCVEKWCSLHNWRDL